MLSRQFVRALRAGCLLAATMAFASTFGAPGASAHAYLVSAVPANGATIAAAPAALTLNYTEDVVPHFCQVSVQGPDGKPVPVGKPEGEPGHPNVLLIKLPHLGAGPYAVTWHALSTDTHHTEGTFHFTVRPTQ